MQSQSRVRIPADWFSPRGYQLPFLCALDGGIRRVAKTWHRRAGKDLSDVAFTAREAFANPGNYYHLMPTYEQGRKVIWDGQFFDVKADRTRRLIDLFPPEVIDGEPKNQTMQIRLKGGGIWQVVGADRLDAIMGTNPRGVVFSEYSLMRPSVWSYMSPILQQNGGWAIFNFTPRGNNHAKKLWDMAKSKPHEWFASMVRADESGVFTTEQLAQIRQEYVDLHGDDAIFRQEYLCSFEASLLGSYYGQAMRAMRESGRLGSYPYREGLPVMAVWDLGVGDATAIGYWQVHDDMPVLVTAVEHVNLGLPQIIDIERRDRPHLMGSRTVHYGPHDVKVREWGSGKSRVETAKEMGIEFRPVPSVPLIDGIESARRLLGACRINEDECTDAVNAFESYGRKWDEVRKVFAEQPNHDWASHSADMLRYSSLVDDFMRSVTARAKAEDGKIVLDAPQWGQYRNEARPRNNFIVRGW